MFRRKTKYYLHLDDEEFRLLVSSLMDFRNELVAAGYYADDVNKLIKRLYKHR